MHMCIKTAISENVHERDNQHYVSENVIRLGLEMGCAFLLQYKCKSNTHDHKV